MVDSDVEQQNFYLKRDVILRYFALASLTKGEKRRDYYYLKNKHIEVFCIDRTTINCYDFVQINEKHGQGTHSTKMGADKTIQKYP